MAFRPGLEEQSKLHGNWHSHIGECHWPCVKSAQQLPPTCPCCPSSSSILPGGPFAVRCAQRQAAAARAILGAPCRVHLLKRHWNRQKPFGDVPARGSGWELLRRDPGLGLAENCCPCPSGWSSAPCCGVTPLHSGVVGFPPKRGRHLVMMTEPPGLLLGAYLC